MSKRKAPTRRSGHKLIFRRYRTTKRGTRLDARAYGLKAWPIWVPDDSK